MSLNYTYITDQKGFLLAMRQIEAQPVLQVDSETTGLNFMYDKPLLLQIGIPGKQFVINLRHVDVSDLKPVFEDPAVVKVVHNSEFDCPFFAWHWGIHTRNIWDSQLVELILLGSPQVPKTRFGKLKSRVSTALGPTLKRRLGIDLDKELGGGGASFIGHTGWKFSDEQLAYAAGDVVYLQELMERQQADLEIFDEENETNLRLVTSMENMLAEVTYRMRVDGIAFNRSYWETLAQKNLKEFNDRVAELDELTGNGVDNWNSPKQVKEYFASIGVPFASYSEFPTMQGINPVLDKFIELRDSYYKNATTYGEKWLRTKFGTRKNTEYDTLGPDGRVHCSFNQIISTGRYSCSKPNLQQLPGSTGHREAFIASKGCTLVRADFSGQELAIMAAGSGEKVWLSALRAREDLHSVMAEVVFADDWLEATEEDCAFLEDRTRCSCPGHKKLRSQGKTINLGLAYGLGPESMGEQMGKTKEETIKIIRRFKGTVPRLFRWLSKNGERAVDSMRAYTLPPFIRYRDLQYEPEDWRRENQGKNTPIQGTAADMIKLSMLHMHKVLMKDDKWKKRGAKLLLPIHDELLTEVKDKYVDEWASVVQRCMERAAKQILGEDLITAKPITGKKWTKED